LQATPVMKLQSVVATEEFGARQGCEVATRANLESPLDALAPFTKHRYLRMRAQQSANGFVSQKLPMSTAADERL